MVRNNISINYSRQQYNFSFARLSNFINSIGHSRRITAPARTSAVRAKAAVVQGGLECVLRANSGHDGSRVVGWPWSYSIRSHRRLGGDVQASLPKAGDKSNGHLLIPKSFMEHVARFRGKIRRDPDQFVD